MKVVSLSLTHTRLANTFSCSSACIYSTHTHTHPHTEILWCECDPVKWNERGLLEGSVETSSASSTVTILSIRHTPAVTASPFSTSVHPLALFSLQSSIKNWFWSGSDKIHCWYLRRRRVGNSSSAGRRTAATHTLTTQLFLVVFSTRLSLFHIFVILKGLINTYYYIYVCMHVDRSCWLDGAWFLFFIL